MTDEHEKHAWRAKLTFRQAERIDPLPQMLIWGFLDREFRLLLYDFFSELFEKHTHIEEDAGEKYNNILQFLFEYHRYIKFELTETANRRSEELGRGILSEILYDKGEIYSRLSKPDENEVRENSANVLEFVTYTLRSRLIQDQDKFVLSEIFVHPRSPYRIHFFPEGAAIIPKNTEAEQRAIECNLKAIHDSSLEGAKQHLKKAIDGLSPTSQPKYADVVREAVHAVESAACVIAGKPKATLSDALKQIKGDLHPALYDGLQKLYGYAGDERGIRHSLVEGENERVSSEEAILAFSICAAIVGFLLRKFPEKS